MKKILLLLTAAVLAFSFISCSKNPNTPDRNVTEPESNVANASGTLPTKDPAGNDIVVPKNVNRIISMAPAITETIVELGLGDKIIAIDKNAKGISGLKEGISEFDMMAPDLEKMMSLKPDMVLTSGMSEVDSTKEPFKALKDAGLCVVVIPTSNSIEAIKSDIKFIADATGTSAKGKEIIENMEMEIANIAQVGKSIDNKKTVYFEIAADPNMYSFGSEVFLNEIIELVGAKNVFADQKSWISVSNEAVVSKNPDIILTNVNYMKEPVKEIKARKGWENMKALKNGDVYYIDNSASSLPNQNIVKAMKEIAKAIYPDKY
ncbi:ABC transporter substrate-binding protein [Acetivibrio cellulolyticus]|uniref:ABC transporter substrate-binding protein n=1 Tax=Acetivibrio cellulolyticus TaxID=35830 RepID=UPI0001E2E379|nr:ABC transporter substrate-binding protein [Acetivibrio cellulolyticus]